MNLSIKEMQNNGLDMLKETIRILSIKNIPYFACFGTVLGAVRHKGYIPWDYDTDICIPIDYFQQFVDLVKKELNSVYELLIPMEKNNPVLFCRLCLKGYNSLTLHLDIYFYVGMPSTQIKREVFLYGFNKISNLYTIKKLFEIRCSKNIFLLLKSICIYLFLKLISSSFLEYLNNKLSLRYKLEDAEFICIPYVPVYGNRKIWNKKMIGVGKIIQFEDISVRVPIDYHSYLKLIYGDYMKYPPREEREYMLNKIFILK